jgi:hypothetical protein
VREKVDNDFYKGNVFDLLSTIAISSADAYGLPNITAGIEADSLGSLLKRLRELDDRRTAIDEQLRNLRPILRLAPEVIENRLAEWRRLLRSSTAQGRSVLQRILIGRLTFTRRRNKVSDEIDGYDFEGPKGSTGCSPGLRSSAYTTGTRTAGPAQRTSALRIRLRAITAACWSEPTAAASR